MADTHDRAPARRWPGHRECLLREQRRAAAVSRWRGRQAKRNRVSLRSEASEVTSMKHHARSEAMGPRVAHRKCR
jgi:hypothetical protein